MNSYPKIGSLVVSKSGSALVHVWPNESDDPRCFTGVSLLDSDCSCMWLIDNFEHCNLFKRGLIAQWRSARKRLVSGAVEGGEA